MYTEPILKPQPKYFTVCNSKTVREKEEDDKKRLEFFQAAFLPNKNYRGYVVFSKKKIIKTENGPIRYFPGQKFFDINAFSDGTFDFKFSGRVDYYMNPNPSCCNQVNNASVFSFSSVVLDLDLHGWTDELVLNAVNDATKRIMDRLGNSENLPIPNAIVFTGRGLQLWWFIEQISYKLEKAYRMFCDYIREMTYALMNANRFQNAKWDISDMGKCELACDKISFADSFRVPLTYNTESKCYGQMILIHKEHINILDFNGKYVCGWKKPHFKKASYDGDYETVNLYRMNALFALTESRIKSGEWGKEGFRNNVIFCLYNCIVHTMGDEKAMDKVHELNRKFPCPLTDHGIESSLCTSRRKNYTMRTQTLIDKLNITEEEQKEFGLHPGGEKAKNYTFRHLTDEERTIICVLCDEGFCKAEIARKMKVSPTTVANVLTTNGRKTRKELNREEAEKLIKKGRTTKYIMKKTGLSSSSVHDLKEKLEKILAERDKKRQEKKEENKRIQELKKENKIRNKKKKEEFEQKRIVGAFVSGSDIKSIAKTTGYSRKDIFRILKENGVLMAFEQQKILGRLDGKIPVSKICRETGYLKSDIYRVIRAYHAVERFEKLYILNAYAAKEDIRKICEMTGYEKVDVYEVLVRHGLIEPIYLAMSKQCVEDKKKVKELIGEGLKLPEIIDRICGEGERSSFRLDNLKHWYNKALRERTNKKMQKRKRLRMTPGLELEPLWD